jgi:arabinofuranosyltransferase
MVSAIKDLPENKTTSMEKRNKKGLLVFSLAFFLFIITKDAWLCDDAYITFRVVDNFIHGYGLTWNTDERVQTYTHPLWMLLLSLVYFFTHEIYYSSLVLSITVSFIAVGIFSLYLARSPLLATLGITVLAASKSFVDFSTSGLENPLTYLLIVIFMLVFYRSQHKDHYVFFLGLVAGLATLNRMDTLLLFLPTLIVVFYQFPGWKSAKALLLGFLPFLCWEAFSLCYYGFLFPNTAYAKLDTGIDRAQLLSHGIGYFVSSFTFDPLPFVIIAVSVLFLFERSAWQDLPFLIGIGLYLLYTLVIGGDFMAGRFLTEPFLIAVILLAHTSFPSLKSKSKWIMAFAIILLFEIVVPNSRWYPLSKSNILTDQRGVTDERAFYADATALVKVEHITLWPNSVWLREGLQARLSGQHVVVRSTIGLFGFGAGPHVHIVDIWALGDPLLARLPEGEGRDSESIQRWAEDDSSLANLPALPPWRIGHFTRSIPAGYLETLASGTNVIHDKQLALYSPFADSGW